jgi:hypothetical protein
MFFMNHMEIITFECDALHESHGEVHIIT